VNLLEQTKYKVFFDESYKAEKKSPEDRRNKEQYGELRGEYGFVYKYSPTQLAVYINSAILKNRLPKAWKVVQHGDWEKTALIPDSDFERACSLVKAKKRRQYSQETLSKLKQIGKNLSRKAV